MIELMVVVIIVGILAAVSIPLYQANVRRAIQTEAVATLGSIRSAERVFKAEYATYTDDLGSLGIDISEPHFFDASCYEITDADSMNFIAVCTNVTGNTAVAAAQATNYFPADTQVAAMDATGEIAE